MILRGLVLVAVILGGIFYNQMGESNLNELSKEQVIIKGINTFIDYLHFQPHDMDADYTDEVFRTYMKSLDSRKQFFTQEEVSQLREFMNQMDDQIDSYDLEFAQLTNYTKTPFTGQRVSIKPFFKNHLIMIHKKLWNEIRINLTSWQIL